MYCRSIWRPTWRSFAAHTYPSSAPPPTDRPPCHLPLPSTAIPPHRCTSSNQHASLTTHSLIHSLSCSSISWAFRTQAGPKRKRTPPPKSPHRTDPIPSDRPQSSKPNQNRPNRRSNGKPQPLHATQSFRLSAFSVGSSPDLGTEWAGTGWTHASCPSNHSCTLHMYVCTHMYMCVRTCVCTHVCTYLGLNVCAYTTTNAPCFLYAQNIYLIGANYTAHSRKSRTYTAQ